MTTSQRWTMTVATLAGRARVDALGMASEPDQAVEHAAAAA